MSPDKTARRDRLAAIAAALAAMLFATKGIFAKQLYSMGVSVEALVTIRATLAVPLFWWLALRREPIAVIRKTPPSAVLAAVMAGALCYYVGALLDFHALTMIDASIERVLIFSYPAMVVLFTSVRDRQRPSGRVLGAVALAYLGIFFTMGGFDLVELQANLFGALLVIGSALTYAVYFIISEKYTRLIGSARFTLIAMTASASCLLVHFAIIGGAAQLPTISTPAWGLLFVIAVVCMFLPAQLQAEGVRQIGAQRGAVMSTVGPPTTVVLAWFLLDERLSGWQWIGIGLIVLGILVLDLTRTQSVTRTQAASQAEPSPPRSKSNA